MFVYEPFAIARLCEYVHGVASSKPFEDEKGHSRESVQSVTLTLRTVSLSPQQHLWEVDKQTVYDDRA